MKNKRTTEAESELLNPMIKEFFDAYILVGYQVGDHKKVVVTNLGHDPACRDGLEMVAHFAGKWKEGSMLPGNSDGPQEGGGSRAKVK